MPYLITKSDGSVLVEVPDRQIITTACSLALPGSRSPLWGFAVTQNFVRLLDNFAGDAAPINPTLGQLWYDKINQKLKVYTGAIWQQITSSADGSGSIPGGVVGGGSGATLSSNIFVAIDGSTTVLATIANGKIVYVTSSVVVINANIPVNIVVGSDNYPFQSRFPTGIAPGITFAIDSGTEYVLKGRAISASYADVAERYAASEPCVPGDLVEIGGNNEIRKTSSVATKNVLGVISTSPALRMNDDAGSDETHPLVALLGRVPCRVTGMVNKGDRIVASNINGVGMAATGEENYVSIIGRAVESKTNFEIETIEIIVGVK